MVREGKGRVLRLTYSANPSAGPQIRLLGRVSIQVRL